MNEFLSEKMPAMLTKVLKDKVEKLINRGQFEEAYVALNKISFTLEAKSEQQQKVSREWLKGAWDEIKNQDYAKAKKIAGDLYKLDNGETKAKVVYDLVSVNRQP